MDALHVSTSPQNQIKKQCARSRRIGHSAHPEKAEKCTELAQNVHSQLPWFSTKLHAKTYFGFYYLKHVLVYSACDLVQAWPSTATWSLVLMGALGVEPHARVHIFWCGWLLQSASSVKARN
jgi:hypothetical protein